MNGRLSMSACRGAELNCVKEQLGRIPVVKQCNFSNLLSQNWRLAPFCSPLSWPHDCQAQLYFSVHIHKMKEECTKGLAPAGWCATSTTIMANALETEWRSLRRKLVPYVSPMRAAVQPAKTNAEMREREKQGYATPEMFWKESSKFVFPPLSASAVAVAVCYWLQSCHIL